MPGKTYKQHHFLVYQKCSCCPVFKLKFPEREDVSAFLAAWPSDFEFSPDGLHVTVTENTIL